MNNETKTQVPHQAPEIDANELESIATAMQLKSGIRAGVVICRR